MKKGFIQIPILIWIIASLVAISAVGTGVVLYRQNKPTANVSESIKPEELSEQPQIEQKPEESSSLAIEPAIESPEPTKKPIIQTPAPTPIIISTPQPTQQLINQPVQNTIDPAVQAQIDALKAEQERQQTELETDRARQVKCAEADAMGKQLQSLCGALMIPTLDKVDACLTSMQEGLINVQNELNEMNDEDTPGTIGYEVKMKSCGGNQELYLEWLENESKIRLSIIVDKQERIPKIIFLKPQYEVLRTACGQ